MFKWLRFELYQTRFHNKNYLNKLFNSKILFVVYKWPLRNETFVIKLNEIKLKCLKFCCLSSLAFCARTQVKVDLQFYCSTVTLRPAIKTSFSSLRASVRYHVPLFRFSEGLTGVLVFQVF